MNTGRRRWCFCAFSGRFLTAALTAWLAAGSWGATDPASLPALLEGIKKSCAARQVDPGHGFTVLPVAQAILAIRQSIAEVRQADPGLVQVAALLHDIGGGGPRGEITGPPIARDVLAEQKCEPGFIDRVCRIIATHHHLKGELVKGLDDTSEWFVVVVADRPQVIEQYQRAPKDQAALTAMVQRQIAALKRDIRWTAPEAAHPASAAPASAPAAPRKDILPPPPAGKQWKLIWHDEFDGNTLDGTKWNRRGDHVRKGGWWLKEDAYLSGKGTLVLLTKKDGDRFTCGAIDTKGKFEHAFGFFVARLQMPRQPGHWPAFWLQTTNMTKVGDAGRDGTEIDIVEVPWRDGRITMNLHWDGYGKEHKSAGANQTKMTELAEGFHDYALLWTPEEYVFYVDGKEVWRTQAGGVSQVPEYLLVTEEIGPWGGDITKAQLPDFCEVDYVRVYELSK